MQVARRPLEEAEVSFETFVAAVGPKMQITMPKPKAGLRQGRNCCGVGKHMSTNDLSLDGIVHSAYGERQQTVSSQAICRCL